MTRAWKSVLNSVSFERFNERNEARTSTQAKMLNQNDRLKGKIRRKKWKANKDENKEAGEATFISPAFKEQGGGRLLTMTSFRQMRVKPHLWGYKEQAKVIGSLATHHSIL